MRRPSAKLVLFGRSVARSLSPCIMSELGRLDRRRVVYRPCAVPPDRLAFAVGLLRAAGFWGANVTTPHKIAVMAHLDRLTPEARRIGAVNTIRLYRGKLIGHNTDADGFMDALAEAGFSPKGRSALIFGAGGAARAVAFALGRLKARRVAISARRPKAARRLAHDMAALFPETAFTAARPAAAEIAVNATPLGHARGDRSPAPASWPGCRLAFDLVYGRRTAFLRQAQDLGARTLDGTAMLVFQALRSWGFWFGPPDRRHRILWKKRILEKLPCA